MCTPVLGEWSGAGRPVQRSGPESGSRSLTEIVGRVPSGPGNTSERQPTSPPVRPRRRRTRVRDPHEPHRSDGESADPRSSVRVGARIRGSGTGGPARPGATTAHRGTAHATTAVRPSRRRRALAAPARDRPAIGRAGRRSGWRVGAGRRPRRRAGRRARGGRDRRASTADDDGGSSGTAPTPPRWCCARPTASRAPATSRRSCRPRPRGGRDRRRRRARLRWRGRHRVRHLVRRRDRHQQPRRRRRATRSRCRSPTARRATPRCSGTTPTSDLAVIKVDATGLPTIELGDSDALQVGDDVVAIGNALALEGGLSVTRGIISGLHREVGTRRRERARRRHPDRRRHQPRQLGRSAGRRAGSGDRHQHRDRRSRRARRTSASPSRSRTPRRSSNGSASGKQPAFLGVGTVDIDQAKLEGHDVVESTRALFVKTVSRGSPAADGRHPGDDVVVAVDGKPRHQRGVARRGDPPAPPGDKVADRGRPRRRRRSPSHATLGEAPSS